ncbi:TetR family transcriptional regulator [Streptomyces goshikiensis]
MNRETVITEALGLLDEVGLDAVSTRRLAKRLNVEQPSLYWYFRTKKDLLTAMAEAAMEPHATAPLPTPDDDWRDWFADNTRSFRRTLLMRRDGARLHAGSTPTGDLDRIRRKWASSSHPACPSGTHRWPCWPPAASPSAASWKSRQTPAPLTAWICRLTCR